ncbi:hypothetical protein TL16_g08286 [Triparma laevis f. inornata]|uniref:WW domain-containing protein n=1 Tax=Triparma laevis f. inornata TaxID=1714386 RepID=A0A9W7B2C2_9STRA|nr:hypothetical protein TL16_g08286 [Triparma laevis f. inornata]
MIMSALGKDKSESTVRWERSKLQARKAVEAISSLSPTRLTPSNFSNPSTGIFQILKYAHILSPTPSSPLLTSLLQHVTQESLPSLPPPDLKHLKSKLISLHTSLRPQTSLDIIPPLPFTSPLTFSSNILERTTKTAGKITQENFKPLKTNCVVCTGEEATVNALHVINPGILGSKKIEDYNAGCVIIETTCDVSIHVNDVVHVAVKDKTSSYEKLKVVAINYNDGGVMVIDNKNVIPNDEDEWKRTLDGSTNAGRDEEIKRGKEDGERCYRTEKEGIIKAREFLERWIKVGRGLKSVSDDLLEDYCIWSSKLGNVEYSRKTCMGVWRGFRPLTGWDNEECKMARVREFEMKIEMERVMKEEEGEFKIHKAKSDYKRSKRDGVDGEEWERVVFKRMKKGEEGEIKGFEDLMVPSVRHVGGDGPGDVRGENVKADSMVVAEVRVGDYVMLKKNNLNLSKMLGTGQGIDSVILLKTRAEKQFIGKSIHSKVIKGRKEEERRNVWNRVLECDMLKRVVKISVVPTALKSELFKWCGLGIFSNAWVYRGEENGGARMWRVPGGDINWGLDGLKGILEEEKVEKLKEWRVKHLESDSDAEEVEEDMNFGLEGMAGEVGEMKQKQVKAALKMGLIKTLPHDVTICWVPSGAKVHVHVANKNGSEWRKVYSGKHGGCQVNKLKDGQGYRFKVECEGRRPSFATYSTSPLPPKPPTPLEWVGSEASRGLKLRLSSSKSKFTVRVETSSYHATSKKIEPWENKGETKDETYIVKGTKVGTGLKVRTRFVMSDGTVGVQTTALDLGVVPRRGGLIVLNYDDTQPAQEKNEISTAPPEQTVDSKIAKLVADDLSTSHPIINFASFFSELQELLPPTDENTFSNLKPTSTPTLDPNLPPGWTSVFSKEYNKSYFYNADKQRSQWTQPNNPTG